MGSSGDVAIEGKMAGVVAGVQGMDLEKGGKRGTDCSIEGVEYASIHSVP